MVGESVGEDVVFLTGDTLGDDDGFCIGCVDESRVAGLAAVNGTGVGLELGESHGALLGDAVAEDIGSRVVGLGVGSADGDDDGLALG
mmetsp:Transcript_4273/g.10879  ORF Transcript_4273/g.10879 Transcript_4273/m.10879 type:complete len:88 (+) Transcript_4273:1118-1381(+)